MMFFPGWIPPANPNATPASITDPNDAETARHRQDTVIHYVVGLFYEHEADDLDCDFCRVPLDSQKSVEYSKKQALSDWKPPIVLADGPINQTIEQALAETADTE